MERIGISDKLVLEVETTMEWRVGEGDSAEGDSGAGAEEREEAGAGGWVGDSAGEALVGRGGALGGDVPGRIEARTRMEVWSDIVAPFSALPKRTLEGSCNAVLRPVVRTLLRTFVQQLGQDYEKWASDPEYREARRRQADSAASGSVA